MIKFNKNKSIKKVECCSCCAIKVDTEKTYKLTSSTDGVGFTTLTFCEKCANDLLIQMEQQINSKALQIKINYHDNEKIEKIQVGDWIDLRASETIELKQGEYKVIPLGVSMELPKGYEAHVLPRSSTFKKYGIIMTNSMGIIDNSYCGDNDIWGFPALAMRDTIIQTGERIAQFRIVQNQEEIEFVETEYLLNKDRGGFGSTGRV